MMHTITRWWGARPTLSGARRAAALNAAALIVAIHLCGLAGWGQPMRGQPPEAAAHVRPRAEVTHIDVSKFPHIRAYVSISDAAGGQIDDNLPAKLRLYENGKPVAEKTLSGGHRVFTVLVIDTSASMAGDTLTKAKEAAVSFIEMSPSNFQTACVRFADSASVVSQFGDGRETARELINS
ncbi:MAG TPA: VWA domain-containing protein, partial [Pyrinomonadaceae bacterium]